MWDLVEAFKSIFMTKVNICTNQGFIRFTLERHISFVDRVMTLPFRYGQHNIRDILATIKDPTQLPIYLHDQPLLNQCILYEINI